MHDALPRWQTTQTSLRSGKESQLQPISLHFGQAISARYIRSSAMRGLPSLPHGCLASGRVCG
jgi:hypothetical protein